MAERDHDPSGPDDEVLYVKYPSRWPVTRATHLARLHLTPFLRLLWYVPRLVASRRR